jgi:hypothetical protein
MDGKRKNDSVLGRVSLKASTREAQRKERLALFKEADLPLVRDGRKKSERKGGHPILAKSVSVQSDCVVVVVEVEVEPGKGEDIPELSEER